MRVLFINSVCGNGSTGRLTVSLAKAVKQAGGEVLVCYGLGRGSDELDAEEIYRFNCRIGYYSHNLLSKITDHTGFYSKIQTRRLIKRIKAFDPDVIHLHNLHGYYVDCDTLFRYLASSGKPVVWTLHDCWVFTGHCTHFAEADCRQWQTECKQCPLLLQYPKCFTGGDVTNNFIHKRTLFTSVKNMTLVTPSEWLEHLVQQSFFKDCNTVTIPNGIDTDVFCSRKSNFREKYNPENKKIVLGVSNVWNRSKGLDDFCSMSEMLPDEYRIVLVGLTPEQLKSIPDKILGICHVESRDELAGIYSAADVFVNPTYGETFGLTTVEAQACGTPAIVYNTGGCPETVKSGRVVPCGNLKELINAVVECCKTPCDEKIDMAEFDNSEMSERYLLLYEKVINQPK